MLASLSEPFIPRRESPVHSDTVRGDENNPAAFIDGLLQDTCLFVMEIHHQSARVRDKALYNRAVKLVEVVQVRLRAHQASDDFTDHVLRDDG